MNPTVLNSLAGLITAAIIAIVTLLIRVDRRVGIIENTLLDPKRGVASEVALVRRRTHALTNNAVIANFRLKALEEAAGLETPELSIDLDNGE